MSQDMTEPLTKRMATFIRECLFEGSWQGCDIDGCWAQDRAQELGLIVWHPYDPAKHGDMPELEEGEQVFFLSDEVKAVLGALPT